MRCKIVLFICPLLLLTATLFAKPLFDSVGVENQNGKKVILHKVDPKDTYFAIGRRYDVKPNLIIQFNNNIMLHPGMIIKVPTALPFVSPASRPEIAESTARVQQYKVSAHETLYAIAKRFNTTVADIKEQNDLRSDILTPGQILRISAGGPPAKQIMQPLKQDVTEDQARQPAQNDTQVQTPEPQTPVNTQNTQQYKVSKGETLAIIARRFNTTTDDIIALNKLTSHSLRPGQVLTVRNGPPPPPPVIAKQDSVMVASPDSSAYHIPANRFGLFEKNEKGPATWMDDPGLDPNKKLVLHRTAPIGTIIKITNPMTNRTTFAKVVGSFADNESTKDVILVVTKSVAESLGVLDKRFRVDISYGVPNNDQ